MQIYTANHFDSLSMNDRFGKKFNKFSGICIETQNYPDAPNHSNFPSAVILPKKPYNHKSLFQFYAC